MHKKKPFESGKCALSYEAPLLGARAQELIIDDL